MQHAFFSTGPAELMFVLLCGAAAGIIRKRTGRDWVWGIPIQIALLAAITPADLLSTVLAAIPVTLVYAVALLRTERKVQPQMVWV